MPEAKARVRARVKTKVEEGAREKGKTERTSSSRAPVKGSLDAIAARGRIM